MAVARALLADPAGRHWGYQLCKAAELRSGVVYPIVHRMFDAGWLGDGWEPSPNSSKPARRYYQVTETGLRELRALVEPRRAG